MLVVNLFLVGEVRSTTYYLQNANVGAASTPGSWRTDATGAGGGTAATNFTTNGDVFNTISGQAAIFTSNVILGLSTGANGTAVSLNVVSSSSATINNGVVITLNGKTTNSSTMIVSGSIIFAGTTGQVLLSVNDAACTFTLAATATLKTANTAGILGTNCSIEKSASSIVTFNSGANFEFNGATNQSGLGLPSIVNDLIINNSSSAIVSLISSTAVNGSFTVNSNSIIDCASNLVTGTGAATINGTLKLRMQMVSVELQRHYPLPTLQLLLEVIQQ